MQPGEVNFKAKALSERSILHYKNSYSREEGWLLEAW